VKGQAAGRTAKGVARGVGGFLRPFRRVGGILWLEMTGAFFFLFVVAVCAGGVARQGEPRSTARMIRAFWPPRMMAVFFYLGVSSFWRARKR
jgi:hypothetical protein